MSLQKKHSETQRQAVREEKRSKTETRHAGDERQGGGNKSFPVVAAPEMDVNGLNCPVKRQILSEWVEQIESSDTASVRDLF